MNVPTIRSRRLDLVSLSPVFLESLLAGRRLEAASLLGARIPVDWPGPGEEAFLRTRLGQLERDPAWQPWLVRGVVARESRRPLLGHAGFHGPPGVNGAQEAGALELGYAVFPSARGRGYATEAAVALIEWARREHGIRRFIASVAPDNAPSLAIVRKLGFAETGERWDEEDGLELVFELGAPS